MKIGDMTYQVQVSINKPGWYRGWETLIDNQDYEAATAKRRLLEAANSETHKYRVVRLVVIEEILP